MLKLWLLGAEGVEAVVVGAVSVGAMACVGVGCYDTVAFRRCCSCRVLAMNYIVWVGVVCVVAMARVGLGSVSVATLDFVGLLLSAS